MKISLQWLHDYIDIQDYFSRPNDLATLLTGAGIEVEGIENRAKQFENVVVGTILKKERHPNADRLTLCQVGTGDGVVHQIVCGARNHNEGDNVAVALPGAVLPGNFAIKKSKIRGTESSGMLCSEKELGLRDESEGILILPPEATVGQSFAKYMGFDDILFELKVTPNRADCLSHFGLAREIACILGREVKYPLETFEEEGGSTRDHVALELRASDLCQRYAGRGVKGVKIGPSPAWLQKRLESVGLKSINNIVDVTNFVMMELGQPLHAFDLRKLKGQRIVVDRAAKGEDFVTLDGTELRLDGTELTIRDAERPIALAGVIGAKNSGIQDDTTEVFIEAAHFAPAGIRRTARKFRIETDSSYRFGRGTNPEAVPLAMNRAAQLIRDVAGGEIMSEPHDQYPDPVKREPIEISLRTLVSRLGFKVDPSEFVDWMKRLGCDTKLALEEGQDTEREPVWSVLPPVFRWDLSLDVDLVEEFARLHGYQHIPETLPPLAVMPGTHDLRYWLESKIRRLLQGEGCLQAVNHGFVARAFQDRVLGDVGKLKAFGLRASSEPVALLNPLNEDLNVMRVSVLPGLLKNVVHNSRHGNSFGRLFELGFGHFKDGGEGMYPQYPQEGRLGFAFWGYAETLWQKGETSPVVFSLKGAVENLLKGLSVVRWKWVSAGATKDVPEFLHPGQAVRLQVDGKAVGFIGTLHPLLAEELKIRETCALAEFNLDKLLIEQPRSPRYERISKFPAVNRDIAFAMPKSLPASEVEAEIRQAAGTLLREVHVFDVFEGGNLPSGQRSVAFRLVFQSNDSTLEDQSINELRDRAVQAVSAKFGVALRG